MKAIKALVFALMLVAVLFSPAMIVFAADSSAPAIEWRTVLGNILLAVLIPVATAIGGLAAWAINLAISKIRNNMAQQLAWQAVLWAEQKFKNEKGTDRYEKAVDWLAEKIPGAKHEDLDKFIEAAVAAMNAQLKTPKVAAS